MLCLHQRVGQGFSACDCVVNTKRLVLVFDEKYAVRALADFLIERCKLHHAVLRDFVPEFVVGVIVAHKCAHKILVLRGLHIKIRQIRFSGEVSILLIGRKERGRKSCRQRRVLRDGVV